MRSFSFEKLVVWQKARELSVFIYKETGKFPDLERYGLISQMRRASISIASNIAEGSGRHSSKDKARFTELAFGSAMELVNHSILGRDLEFLSENAYHHIREAAAEITAMLNGLRKAQLTSETKNKHITQ